MIMFISFIFSIVIYANVDRELVRFENFQVATVDEKLIDEARNRLVGDLILLNSLIFFGAGAAGYFLAGRTLDPIRRMIESQSRFFGDASHELKTPITSLKSEIEIYFRLKKRSLKEADKVIKSNLEEVDRIQNLTNNLLTLATLEKVGLKKEFLSVNMSEILEEASKRVSAQAKKKRSKMVIHSKDIYVSGNENNLIQLFTILLDNAIKYSKSGSRVTVIVDRDGDYVSTKVTDNGIGIPKGEIENIFDRFYRVDESRTSGDAGGFGLGLSIAKEIVTHHKGFISAKSGSQKTTFTVDLPES